MLGFTDQAEEEEGAYSCVACVRHFTLDFAPFSRWGIVLTPDTDTSNFFGASVPGISTCYVFPVY